MAAGEGRGYVIRAKAEMTTHVQLLRDIFGNPFRPVSAAPSWLAWNDGTVRKMAQAIYDERRLSELPLLADALEDAGCTNPDILSHCRGPGPHAGVLGRPLLYRKGER